MSMDNLIALAKKDFACAGRVQKKEERLLCLLKVQKRVDQYLKENSGDTSEGDIGENDIYRQVSGDEKDIFKKGVRALRFHVAEELYNRVLDNKFKKIEGADALLKIRDEYLVAVDEYAAYRYLIEGDKSRFEKRVEEYCLAAANQHIIFVQKDVRHEKKSQMLSHIEKAECYLDRINYDHVDEGVCKSIVLLKLAMKKGKHAIEQMVEPHMRPR